MAEAQKNEDNNALTTDMSSSSENETKFNRDIKVEDYVLDRRIRRLGMDERRQDVNDSYQDKLTALEREHGKIILCMDESYQDILTALKREQGISILSMEKNHVKKMQLLTEQWKEDIHHIEMDYMTNRISDNKDSDQSRKPVASKKEKRSKRKWTKANQVGKVEVKTIGNEKKPTAQELDNMSEDKKFDMKYWRKIEEMSKPAKRLKYEVMSHLEIAKVVMNVIIDSARRYKRSSEVMKRLDEVGVKFVEIGIEKSLFVKFFLRHCLFGKERSKISVSEIEVKSLCTLNTALENRILGTIRYPERTAFKDLKAAFECPEKIDLESIAQKCEYHAKEIEAGTPGFAGLSEQEKESRIKERKKEMLLKNIPVFCGEDIYIRCIENSVFNENTFMKILEKLKGIIEDPQYRPEKTLHGAWSQIMTGDK